MADKSITNCGGLLVDETQMEVDASKQLTIKSGVVVPSEASTTVVGGALQMANQADSVAEDTAGVLVDFNALLTALKTAGYMVADE